VIDRWEARRVSLVAKAGSIRAVTLSFQALVLDAHWSELVDHPELAVPPFERLRGEVDVLLIRSQPIDGRGTPAGSAAEGRRGLIEADPKRFALGRTLRYVPSSYDRAYIDMSTTFDGYLGKFSSKSRSTLKRKVSKLAKLSAGKIDLREYHRPDEILEFHGIASELSRKTYQERLFAKGLPTDEKSVRAMVDLAAAGNARAYLLFLEGKPIAYLYCPVTHDVLLYEFLGYDPEFKEHSPGTVLQHVALERLFAEKRFTMFDFTEGEGTHKEFFATGSRRCADVFHFRRTPRNFAAVGLHSGAAVANREALRLLERWGVKTKVKTFVRERLPNWMLPHSLGNTGHP
jgi:Acetyltransferase (GNAT) domain